METLINRIESACKEKGISLSALAEKIGKSRAAATRWRRGGGIDGDTAADIAKVLSVTSDWLLTGKESRARGEVVPVDMNALISVATETYLPELVRLQELQEKGVLVDADIEMLRVIINRYKDRR